MIFFRKIFTRNQQLAAAVCLTSIGLATLGCEGFLEIVWDIDFEDPSPDTGYDTYFIEDTETSYWIDTSFPDTEIETDSDWETLCAGGKWWHKEGVGTVDETAHSDAIGVIGPDGNFHLAFADRTALTYAVKSSDAWTLEYVDETDSRGAKSIDMVVDADGKAHIVYEGTDSIMYATNAGGGFTMVPLAGALGCPCSLAMGNDGTLHLASVANGLTYLSGNGGEWTAPLQISRESHHRGVSLILDFGDAVHISYYGPGLYYATNFGGSWTDEYIYRGGIDSSFALDPEGILYIAHSESPYGDLILSENMLGSSNEWTHSVWTSDDDRHTAGSDLAVSGDGRLHLSEFKYDGIMYAVKMPDQNEWREFLMSDDQVPWTWPRIAVDHTAEEIHIVYGREGDIAHLWTDHESCE
jgi:hypothetical protein